MRPLHILIIDDDKSMVAFIENILKQSNRECRISVAKHGAAAFDLIENNQFDIALIDLWLPDMNGLDILARIKEVNPCTACHVISSQGDDSYINKAKMLGVKQYIMKPFEAHQILALIDEFCPDSLNKTT